MTPKKTTSMFSEIHSIQPDLSDISPSHNPDILAQKILQFRGGQSDFEQAYLAFIKAYQEALSSCQILHYYFQQPLVCSQDDFFSLFPQIHTSLAHFFQDYSEDEKQTLTSMLLFSDLNRTLTDFKNARSNLSTNLFTQKQLASFLLLWFNYHLFENYLLFDSQSTHSLITILERWLFLF
jgi:hypothetical protein